MKHIENIPLLPPINKLEDICKWTFQTEVYVLKWAFESEIKKKTNQDEQKAEWNKKESELDSGKESNGKELLKFENIFQS